MSLGRKAIPKLHKTLASRKETPKHSSTLDTTTYSTPLSTTRESSIFKTPTGGTPDPAAAPPKKTSTFLKTIGNIFNPKQMKDSLKSQLRGLHVTEREEESQEKEQEQPKQGTKHI